MGFPRAASDKEPACQCRRCKRLWFDLWVGKIPWRKAWQPTPVFLPGESQGQRSPVSYNPWGFKESDTTEHMAHGMARNGDESIWIIRMNNCNPMWVLAQDECGCQSTDMEQTRTWPPRD